MTTRERARRREDAVEAVDILIAEADDEDAARIRDAMGPLVNRVEMTRSAQETADRLFHRGRWSRERRTPDLVILDAGMIGDGCWQMIERLKGRDGYEDSVIVVVAGKDGEDADRAGQSRRAYEAGARWFVGKPVRTDVLRRIVDDLEDMGFAVVRARRPAVQNGTERGGTNA